MNKDYLDLVNFWNQNFVLTEEEKEQILSQGEQTDYKLLAPSPKLCDALSIFNEYESVLDYGCGSGWASIIMAKNGVKKITSVEVAHESIEMVKCYAKAFDVDTAINALPIDENWLKNQKEGVFDGFFCSNVIDVVPLDMAKEIIKNSSRVLKNGGVAIFSLNFYIEPNKMLERGCIVKDKQIYIDGVLRLTSLTDDEWKELLSPYYEIVSLSYFSWPGEQKDTRRIFVLRKK